MATPAQLAANQANAKRSTGPVTAEGKQRASKNALRHGFRSKLTVLPNEDPAEYELLAGTFEEHYPATSPIAARAVREMIDAEWRLRRVRQASDRTFYEFAKIHAAKSTEPGFVEALTFRDVEMRHPHLFKHELKYERQFDRAWRAYRTASASREAGVENPASTSREAGVENNAAPDPTVRSGVSTWASASREASVANNAPDPTVSATEPQSSASGCRTPQPEHSAPNNNQNATNEPTSEGTPNEVRGGETQSRAAAATRNPQVETTKIATNEPNPIPRNATCPCRSGLKYKRCCGKTAPMLISKAA
jgi:hypothetical protein